ncbi:MAG: hypothetical protein A07HN63_01805 [uncultured archaeon A07HN63]|nr:MAG: hypothetical protein A07HN63_01805 [uncultured archaeon A07HN63]
MDDDHLAARFDECGDVVDRVFGIDRVRAADLDDDRWLAAVGAESLSLLPVVVGCRRVISRVVLATTSVCL